MEYTDATFSKRKIQPKNMKHLGILGMVNVLPSFGSKSPLESSGKFGAFSC